MRTRRCIWCMLLMLLGSQSREYVLDLNCSETVPAEIMKRRQMKEQFKAHIEK